MVFYFTSQFQSGEIIYFSAFAEFDVGYYAKKIFFVFFIKLQTLFVRFSHDNFRPGTHSEETVREIKPVGHQFLGLPHYHRIQKRQISRIKFD